MIESFTARLYSQFIDFELKFNKEMYLSKYFITNNRCKYYKFLFNNIFEALQNLHLLQFAAMWLKDNGRLASKEFGIIFCIF